MNKSTKYFFNRSFEILHRKSFDSYRLSLNNPYIIFDELKLVIEKFVKKKVKYFNPTVSEVGSEAYDFLNNEFIKNLLLFEPFTKNQIIDVLNETCIKSKSDNKVRSLALISKTIVNQNTDFKKQLLDRIIDLLEENNDSNFKEIDVLTGWLHSQLIHLKFSKNYIEFNIRKCGNNIFKNGKTIRESFEILNRTFDTKNDEYKVIFKIKLLHNQILIFASTNIELLSELPNLLKSSTSLNSKFKEKSEDEIFIQVIVYQHDFWSSVIEAYQLLSASIEINELHNSENKIIIEAQAVTIHTSSNKIRVEKIEQTVDGFYHHNDTEFTRFVTNLKNISSNTAKEKISSAIRFYKLGNESIEMEHKILNYWIGFEQIFSAIDSNEDAINRMKVFYSSLNISYYFQRKINYLISSLNRNGILYYDKEIDFTIFNNEFDKTKLTGKNPVLIKRLEDYFKFNNRSEIKKYIELHTKRLNQHLTRIYRVRNELVHEGKTNMNVRLLAGHLRHYLLFTIEQLTNEISENQTIDKIDDAFVYFENLKERIKLCENLNEIIFLKSYNGYSE